MDNFSELFDLTKTAHAELFSGVKYPWEVLKKLAAYCAGKKIIGAGTVIEPGAVIKDNVIIGKNCVIRSGAYIRENSVLGDEVVIGQSSEVKNSLIFNSAQIAHLNYVGDSILGYKTHLAAGAIISNVKIPEQEIIIKAGEETYATGLRKFGALVGDGTEVGCNSVINPGSILGKGCILYPLTSWRGILSQDSLVKVRQTQEVVIKRA